MVLLRLLRAFLYGVGSADPVTMIVVAAILAGIAILACYLPARRVASIDPLIALRTD